MTQRLPRILVMMATYNGERYLREQIDSILAQEEVAVSLRICDDLSTDGTAAICQGYASRGEAVVFSVNEHNLGVGKNFMQMVYGADPSQHEYFAFSDQDDVWLPQKLAVAVEAIKQEEARTGAKELDGFGVPVLYCSDVLNVDERLANGRCELASLKIDLSRRATPLIRNVYSGCTMAMNAAMLRLLQSYGCAQTEFYRIHDVWCVMVAYYCGNFIVDLSTALILRRITGWNTGGEIYPGRSVRRASFKHLRTESAHAPSLCAERLLDGYSQYMACEDRKLIEAFVSCRSSLAMRIKWAFSSRFYIVSRWDDVLARVKLLLGRY